MTSSQTTPPSPPRIPTGQELFDTIMGHIEPELTSEGRKQLSEKYKDEKPEDRFKRKKRYQVALKRYKEAFEGTVRTLSEQVERYRRSSIEDIEARDRARESAGFSSVFDSLQAA